MPREDDQKPKRRPGRPTYRTFHDKIGFHIGTTLHQAMKQLSSERSTGLEKVYEEAINHLIRLREQDTVLYMAAPLQPASSRVMVTMEPGLAETVRSISRQDHHSLSDVFHTAVRLYLTSLTRLPS